MNYKRGMTRAYVIASALWVAFALYRPVLQRDRNIAREHRVSAANYYSCVNRSIGDREWTEKRRLVGEWLCQQEQGEADKTAIAAATANMEYSSNSGLLLLALECVAPPVIAYFVFFGFYRVIRWVLDGFKQAS